MDSRKEIVERLVRERAVETMVQNIAHQSMNADLEDLSQMVYMILLEYDEAKILDLWRNNQMNFFIARIVINQFRSSNSPFHTLFRRFREMSEDITGKDFTDEQ